jgi:hypothetical protein
MFPAVRHAIYEFFAKTGRAPTVERLANMLALDEREIVKAFDELQAEHLLALAPATHNIWMAHPFSAVPTPFQVTANQIQYFANCAWDALAIPTLLEVDANIDMYCGDCNSPARFEVRAGKLSSNEGGVHYPIPPSQFWDNIGLT